MGSALRARRRARVPVPALLRRDDRGARGGRLHVPHHTRAFPLRGRPDLRALQGDVPRQDRAGRGGTKSGFDPADQRIAEWFAFDQARAGSARQGGLGFWLSTGWGDHYRWQRPGQYVEFAGNTDGHYVVRATVDADKHVLETDELDNTGYAYVQIVGEDVRIIERGRGLDPWDPAKVVL